MDVITALPERPEPPDHLTDEEAAEWRAIVATKPAEWFMRDCQPVLIALCQAIAMHRKLMGKWHETGEYRLVELVVKVANQIAQLSAKLRLTPQSRYTPQSANTASKKADGRSLWKKVAG